MPWWATIIDDGIVGGLFANEQVGQSQTLLADDDVRVLAYLEQNNPFRPEAPNATAIRTFLTNEVEALRTARQNFPDTLTNAQRDQAIKRLAKDVEYMMRIMLHAFDHAD